MAITDAKIHPSDRMTSRERLLAAYRGEEVDRLPYWAKVANPTWRLGQPAAVHDVLEDFARHRLGLVAAHAAPRFECLDGVHVVPP